MNPQNPNIFQTLKNTNFLLTPLGNSNTETDINVAEYANKK